MIVKTALHALPDSFNSVRRVNRNGTSRRPARQVSTLDLDRRKLRRGE
jgi:hypothetical protein